MSSRCLATSALLCAVLASLPVWGVEEEPTLLSSFRDWHVYTAGMGAARTCFAVSVPKDSSPAGARRGPIFFMITSWPERKVKNEPSVVPGYPYKDMSTAEVTVGADKFAFAITKADGAWMEAPEDEQRLIAALRKGSSMSVTGVSARGTMTVDNYSLAGISAALDKIDTDCK